MLYHKPLLSYFAVNAKKGVKRMPVVVKRQDLRVYVTRSKKTKTKTSTIVVTVVMIRSSNCKTCD